MTALSRPCPRNHDPPPSEIVQCFKFHTRMRTSGELIAAYVATLRTLGQTCGFGDSQEDMIRDQLLCRVNNNKIHRRLLGVTYTKKQHLISRKISNLP